MLTSWTEIDQTFQVLDALQRQLDGAFGGWAEGPREGRAGLARPAQRPPWPAVNGFETKDAFVYQAQVPGLSEADVSVFVEDEVLVLRGERKSDVPQGYEVHLRERAPVAFNRKLELAGRVDADAVTATMRDGVLTVTLPKAKDTLPRQIAVKAV